MNKRTRKRRMAVRRGRRGDKMTEVLVEAVKERNAAAELSEKMRGVHPLGQMLVSVLAKVAGQPGADLLMAEAAHGFMQKTPAAVKPDSAYQQAASYLNETQKNLRVFVEKFHVEEPYLAGKLLKLAQQLEEIALSLEGHP